MIPETIEHHKPECKQHNISVNLLYYIFFKGLCLLHWNKVLNISGVYTQATGQTTSQPGPDQPTSNNVNPGNEEVTDVDFEEVK